MGFEGGFEDKADFLNNPWRYVEVVGTEAKGDFARHILPFFAVGADDKF